MWGDRIKASGGEFAYHENAQSNDWHLCFVTAHQLQVSTTPRSTLL